MKDGCMKIAGEYGDQITIILPNGKELKLAGSSCWYSIYMCPEGRIIVKSEYHMYILPINALIHIRD